MAYISRPKVPGVKRLPSRPRGPAKYRLNSIPRRQDSIFLNPPLEFDSPTTSNTEWWGYVAMSLITGTPKDFTKPPFTGGLDWQYQGAIEGGRMHRGGQVVDYIYQDEIGIRLQTGYWHFQQGADTYYKDLFLREHTKALSRIVDVYDVDFIHDVSGETCCKIFALALKGIQMPDPWRTGTFAPVYPGIG